MAKSRNIIAQTLSNLAEEKTFLGQNYLVVPVVAMVEGVRMGGNQTEPELGLAEDFGKYPAAWNNRPLVINHPQINGEFVSANLIDVLESESFGFTAGTHVDEGKLKMDAWISLSRAEELEEVQGFVEKIQSNEMIEVSVGFFSDVEKRSGKFKNQSYGGIWRNIVPDHLAFLTQAKGACSVADGCGVPRINQSKENTGMTLKADSHPNINATDEPCSCGCDSAPKTNAEAPKIFEITAQTIAETVADSSIYKNLEIALFKHLADKFQIKSYDIWLNTYTAGEGSIAVYSLYQADYVTMMGIRFDMADDGTINFQGEPFNVRIVSHVYKSGNQENNMSTQETQKETSATPTADANTETPKEPVGQSAADTPATAAPASAPAAPSAPTAPAVQENVPAAPKVLSREEALKAMSAEDQAVFTAALKLHNERRDEAITALKESGRCKFSDDYLKAQSLDTLENLVELSAAPNYGGRPAPTAPTGQSASDNSFVPAPKVFETKKATTE